MSDTLEHVKGLVADGKVRVSLHGFRELAADDILLEDIIAGLVSSHVVEDYPSAAKGPSVLVLQHDAENRPIHVVWASRRE